MREAAWTRRGVGFHALPAGYGWVRRGIGFHAVKAADDWDAREHPRDRNGRFVRRNATVRLFGGGTGRITGFDSSTRKFLVRRDADGETVRVLPAHVTVIGEPGEREPAPQAAPRRDPVLARFASPVPSPEPEPPARGETTGLALVPSLAWSQRDTINSYNFDTDTSQPELVRTAATAVRDKTPMTADQANALADALRAQGAKESAARARALGRAAGRLETTSAELVGIAPQHVPVVQGVSKITPADVGEGDTIALATGRGGTADVFRVVSTVPWYGNFKMRLEAADGTVDVRQVTPGTDVFLLPDSPPDEPVPPDGPVREHLSPDRLRRGDIIEYHGVEREVTDVVGHSDGTGWTITAIDVYGRSRHFPTSSSDGLPSIVRVRRGPTSVDQPYDAVMQPEDPTDVPPADVRVGDRVRVPFSSGMTTTIDGTVMSITDSARTLHNAAARILTVRTDNGATRRVSFELGGDDDSLIRLVAADDNGADRIARQLAEGQRRIRARKVAVKLAELEENAYQFAARAGGSVKPFDSKEAALASLTDLFGGEHDPPRMDVSALGNIGNEIARLIAPTAPLADRQVIMERLQPLLNDVSTRARNNVRAAIRDATPEPGEPDSAAVRRVVLRYDREPPPSDFTRIADLLTDLDGRLSGTAAAGPDLPTFPELPDDADLKTRMAAYREIARNFGKKRVHRTMPVPPRLQDLEAGKAPDVETVDVYVPDRADDGGPGETTMRQLAALRAAGRDLDKILRDRMHAERREAAVQKERLEKERERTFDELDQAMRARFDEMNDNRDRLARQNGFDSWSDLIISLSYAREANDNVRLKELDRLRNRLDKLADDQTPLTEPRRVEKRLQIIDRRITEANYRSADSRRKQALALLSEVRGEQMGGELLPVRAAKSDDFTDAVVAREFDDLRSAMRLAEDSYPRSWLEQAKGEIQLTVVKRGYHIHNDKTPTIALSKGASQTQDPRDKGYGRVAVHELGHRMEQMVPGLLEAEEAILYDRTSTGEVGARTRQKLEVIGGRVNEVGWRDEFREHYTGRDYGGRAYEVFTTAAESLLAGSLYLDEDLRHWTLGVMALL